MCKNWGRIPCGDGNYWNVGNNNQLFSSGGCYNPIPGSYNNGNTGYSGSSGFGNMGPYNSGYSGGDTGLASLIYGAVKSIWSLFHQPKGPELHASGKILAVRKAPQSTPRLSLAPRVESGYQSTYSGGQRRMGINTTNNTTLDIDAAVDCLVNRAEKKSQSKCAQYVRIALEAGGINTTGRPRAAKYYQSFLINKGFEVISNNGYSPIKGDISVFEAFQGRKKYNQYGHMQMYAGENNGWISDFRQAGFWPGRDYRDYKPEYKLLRFKKDEKENDYGLYNFLFDIF